MAVGGSEARGTGEKKAEPDEWATARRILISPGRCVEQPVEAPDVRGKANFMNNNMSVWFELVRTHSHP